MISGLAMTLSTIPWVMKNIREKSTPNLNKEYWRGNLRRISRNMVPNISIAHPHSAASPHPSQSSRYWLWDDMTRK